jgi:hypothetical protein
MSQECLELSWIRTVDQKWSQCLGRLVRYHSVAVRMSGATSTCLKIVIVRHRDSCKNVPRHKKQETGKALKRSSLAPDQHKTHYFSQCV